jgi:hypothetical protein
VCHGVCVLPTHALRSETNLVIDFRTVAGDPDPAAGAVTAAPDVERIGALAPKTVIPIGELPTGAVYSFYPVGVGSNAPLANSRLTETGGFVAVSSTFGLPVGPTACQTTVSHTST